jgi:transcriptional regulator with XRE-family HTH domain
MPPVTRKPDAGAPLPPRRVTPAGVVDERFAANVRETRERLGLSQGEVARRMADAGWPYYQQTVARIEDGRRKPGPGEAHALAEILGTSVAKLAMLGREAGTAAQLETTTARAHRAAGQVGEWTADLLVAQSQLRRIVGEAEAAEWLGSDLVRRLAEDAAEALALSPEDAVRQAREGIHGDTGGASQ